MHNNGQESTDSPLLSCALRDFSTARNKTSRLFGTQGMKSKFLHTLISGIKMQNM